MSEATERGVTDHRVVHGFELAMKHLEPKVGRMAAIQLATAAVLHDEARRWWERRGYTFPEPERTDDAPTA